MAGSTFILAIYSSVASLIIVVLSVLYHNCGGQPNIQGNSGVIDESSEYEIALINEMIKERKLTKAAKMRKAILEEYQNGFPAHPESSEEKVELG